MDIKDRVKLKHSIWSDEIVSLFIEKAKSICIDYLYPADMSVSVESFEWDSYPRLQMWVLDCVEELAEREGISSATAYKENGMSITFDRAQVSQALLDRLPRLAATIKG